MKVVLDTNVLIMSISKGSPLLRNIDYPRIEVIDIDNFVAMLQKLPFEQI